MIYRRLEDHILHQASPDGFFVDDGSKRILGVDRSSRLEVFCKKSVIKNFAKFTGKYLDESLFFDKFVFL